MIKNNQYVVDRLYTDIVTTDVIDKDETIIIYNNSSGGGLTTEQALKLAGIQSGAEVNQNAFSFVTLPSGTITTLAAISKTDTLKISGTSPINITIDENRNLTFSLDSSYPTVHQHTNMDALNLLSIVDGKLQIIGDVYSTGEMSAYGLGIGGGSSATDLNALTDVTLTSLLPNDLLYYNGSFWVNTPVSSFLSSYATQSWVNSRISTLGCLTGVVLTNPVVNDTLVYNGTNWVNSTTGGGGNILSHIFYDAINNRLYTDVDFYSEGSISAYGIGTGQSSGGASTLYQLTDVSENNANDGVLGAIEGSVLKYNSTTSHWEAMDLVSTLSTKWTTNNTSISHWDNAYTHSLISGGSTIHHTHSNKSLLDSISQENIDVLLHLFYDDATDTIKVDKGFWSTGEISAYGIGSGGSGTVTSLSQLTDVINTLSPINGDVLYFDSTESKWVNKASSLLQPSLTNYYTKTETDTKYALIDHVHTFASLTSKPTTIGGYGITDAVLTTDSRLSNARYNPYAITFTGYSSAIYDGSNAVIVALPTKVSDLSNDSGFLTGITKSQIEAVLTGTITSHNHNYLTGNQTITISGDVTGSGSTSISLTLANSGVTIGTYKSVTVDAKGRVTAGTNPTTLSGYGIVDAANLVHTHNYAGSSSAGGKANSVANKLTFSGYSSLSYDGSTAVTIPIPNNTNQLTNGAGFITSSGNAATATALSSSRTFALTGVVTGTIASDLTSGFTINTSISANSIALGTNTVGNYAATIGVSGNGLTITGSAGEGTAYTVNSNATNLNTASTVVFRDVNGNFSAGTITAALSGNATTSTTLQTIRTLWGQSFNGSSNVTGALSSVTDITMSGILNLGSAQFIYDATSNTIRVQKSDGTAIGFYSTGEVASYGVGSAGGTSYINAALNILTTNNDAAGINLLKITNNGSDVLKYTRKYNGYDTYDLILGSWSSIQASNRLDFYANQIFFNTNNTYYQSSLNVNRIGDASSTSTQKNSYPLVFQTSIWNGSSQYRIYHSIKATASTTINGSTRLSFIANTDEVGQNGTEIMAMDPVGVKITGTITSTGSGTFTGGSFSSLRSLKTIHNDWQGNALLEISKFKVRDFNYNGRLNYDRTLGLIVDEIPESIGDYILMGENRDSVNLYSLHALSILAHQEEKIRIEQLEQEVLELKQKINQLEIIK